MSKNLPLTSRLDPSKWNYSQNLSKGTQGEKLLVASAEEKMVKGQRGVEENLTRSNEVSAEDLNPFQYLLWGDNSAKGEMSPWVWLTC